MKINKSKRQLAQLLIEAGVTQFPEGSDWAVQDKCDGNCMDRAVSFFGGKHKQKWFGRLGKMWKCAVPDTTVLGYEVSVALPIPIPNWHHTALSRAEFDQIVAETAPDADEWIEWNGGGCPVAKGVIIDVKFRDGTAQMDCEARSDKSPDHKYWTWIWSHSNHASDIIAYRPHKPEQAKPEFCESVTRSIPEPAAAPTLDQLLQDWRNADDYAQRKQTEADEAAAIRDERWQAVQARAGELNVTVERISL